MAVRLERSSRYWYHTFITSDGAIFKIDSTRTMAEHSPVIRKLVHDISEIRKPSYPPISLSFCTGAEFEMLKDYVEKPEQLAMREKINSKNLDAWCVVAKKFELRMLRLYCIYFVIYEVHDSSPELDYVLQLAEIACKHRMRFAFGAIVRFYSLYHPDLLQNAMYIHKLSQVIPKSAVAILSTDITQYNKWVQRFSHDWYWNKCTNKNCSGRTMLCRRCGVKFCSKCGSYLPTEKENGFSCGQCYNNDCRCNFDKCYACCFCQKKWGQCRCTESKIPDIMWEADFDEI